MFDSHPAMRFAYIAVNSARTTLLEKVKSGTDTRRDYKSFKEARNAAYAICELVWEGRMKKRIHRAMERAL